MGSEGDARRRTRVGVLFGGKSPEHDISIRTAHSIISALDGDDTECFPVYIEPTGRWRSGAPLDALVADARGGRFRSSASSPALVTSDNSLLQSSSPSTASALSAIVQPQVDVFIPAIHGIGGEDGSLQGLFELADIAYVGAGILGSAVGLDKIMMKQALAGAGFSVVDYLAFTRVRWETEPEAVLDDVERRLGYPAFTKSATSGSSIGVARVEDRRQLADGVADAARYSRRLLVERALRAREIEVGIVGNDSPEASVCGEVRSHAVFYDYGAKYDPDGADLLIPADLPERICTKIRELAAAVFTALDCSGMARVDFFYEPSTERIWVNEINTIPGFTETSMFPRLWAASGISFPTLLRKLIALAQERRADRHKSELHALPRV